jgi:hypothetical protein
MNHELPLMENEVYELATAVSISAEQWFPDSQRHPSEKIGGDQWLVYLWRDRASFSLKPGMWIVRHSNEEVVHFVTDECFKRDYRRIL